MSASVFSCFTCIPTLNKVLFYSILFCSILFYSFLFVVMLGHVSLSGLLTIMTISLVLMLGYVFLLQAGTVALSVEIGAGPGQKFLWKFRGIAEVCFRC